MKKWKELDLKVKTIQDNHEKQKLHRLQTRGNDAAHSVPYKVKLHGKLYPETFTGSHALLILYDPDFDMELREDCF